MTLVLSDHLCRFYTIIHILVPCFFFFFKQKTAYEIGLGIPAEPLFRSHDGGYYTVNSHTVLDGIITTIMATIQRINIIGSREGSRNRRRLKANQTGKKFRVGIKSNISTNRNNLISGVDRDRKSVV